MCFAVWRPSRGASRLTALIVEPVLPRRGDRRVHGNASFTARYFERALGAAIEAGGGLALLHSHPGATGSQGMSHDDAAAEGGHAGAALGGTGLPLIGLTLATGDGSWSARAWERSAPRTHEPVWCDPIRVTGRRLSISTRNADMSGRSREELDRTVAAWGEAVQRRL